MNNPLLGVLLAGAVLLSIGWFGLGWAARGHDNQRYADSRLQALLRQELSTREDPAAVWAAAERPQPQQVVVNNYFPHPNPAATTPVIPSYQVRELP